MRIRDGEFKRVHLCVSAATFAFRGVAHGEIVDRIAVVIDRAAIKQSDIMKEIRLTAFI
jgi:hypothetical protein